MATARWARALRGVTAQVHHKHDVFATWQSVAATLRMLQESARAVLATASELEHELTLRLQLAAAAQGGRVTRSALKSVPAAMRQLRLTPGAVPDALQYDVELPAATYAAGVEAVVAALGLESHVPLRNHWPAAGDRAGVMAQFAEGVQVWFYTTEALAALPLARILAKELRRGHADADAAAQLAHAWDAAPTPPGAEALGSPAASSDGAWVAPPPAPEEAEAWAAFVEAAGGVADQLLAASAAAEPVMHRLVDFAAAAVGGALRGDKPAVMTRLEVLRKLRQVAARRDIADLASIARSDVFSALRFEVQLPFDSYCEAASEVVDTFERVGCETVVLLNYWHDTTGKKGGLLLWARAPPACKFANFQVRLHTAKGFDVRNLADGADTEADAAWERIERPEGVDDVGVLRRQGSAFFHATDTPDVQALLDPASLGAEEVQLPEEDEAADGEAAPAPRKRRGSMVDQVKSAFHRSDSAPAAQLRRRSKRLVAAARPFGSEAEALSLVSRMLWELQHRATAAADEEVERTVEGSVVVTDRELKMLSQHLSGLSTPEASELRVRLESQEKALESLHGAGLGEELAEHFATSYVKESHRHRFQRVAQLAANVALIATHKRGSSGIDLQLSPVDMAMRRLGLQGADVGAQLDALESWDFDIFRLRDTVGAAGVLPLLASVMLTRLRLAQEFRINPATADNFFVAVAAGYRENPYHNTVHGADVMQGMYFLCSSAGMQRQISDLQTLSSLVAAAVHDLGHPGVNNPFLVATRDDLALTYNDQSPLENFHVAQAFRILAVEDNAFLASLAPAQHHAMRAQIIAMVLATDNSHHLDVLSSFQAKLDTFDWGDSDDQLLALRLALHACDVSNPTKPRALYQQWTDSIMEEFYTQGERERALGLAIKPGGFAFLDREQPVRDEDFQTGFINFIVSPLWEHFAQLPGVDVEVCVSTLRDNAAHWLELKAASAAAAAAAADQDQDS